MQNSYRKTQSKTKQKQKTNKEMFCLVTKSNCSVFFSTFQITSFWIAVPWPQRLSVKPTISLLLKNAIDLLLCFEHKLYGFAQSDISEFKIRCDVLLILVLRMCEVMALKFWVFKPSTECETLRFMLSQNLSKRARNGGSMYSKTVCFSIICSFMKCF